MYVLRFDNEISKSTLGRAEGPCLRISTCATITAPRKYRKGGSFDFPGNVGEMRGQSATTIGRKKRWYESVASKMRGLFLDDLHILHQANINVKKLHLVLTLQVLIPTSIGKVDVVRSSTRSS